MPELLVPKLNNNDADYVLTDWLAQDGTPVTAGAPIAVVETSKAAEELEADSSGVLHHRLPAGTRCRPGELIAFIADGSSPAGPEAASATAPTPATAPAATGGPLVTRPAQALMDELGVTLQEVAALGVPVVKREHVAALRPAAQAGADIPPAPATVPSGAGEPARDRPAATAAPAGGQPAEGERIELGRVQQGVARAVQLSHQSIPAAYTVVRFDLGPALGYAADVTRKVRRPVGLAELFVQGVAALQREFPRFFAAVDEGGRTATLADAPHVGVTVDLGEGLYVPCVRDAADLALGEIATQLMKYRIAATKGAFRERDLVGANFVVTLHTDADVVLAVPFVLPGTVCALAVTSPVDGTTANIGLAYDHRLINGREASLFLHALRTSMEGLTS